MGSTLYKVNFVLRTSDVRLTMTEESRAGGDMVDVLLVEDDELFSASLIAALEMWGVEVRSVRTIGDAMVVLDAGTPRLVLVDLSIDRFDDGFPPLKALVESRGVPLVLMSGAQNLAVRAEKLAVKRWIRKPFDVDQLKSVFAQVGIAVGG